MASIKPLFSLRLTVSMNQYYHSSSGVSSDLFPKVATLKPAAIIGRRLVGFSAEKKGESRYEETISDRTATSRAAVPPDRPRTKSQHPDDSSAGRHRRPVAARRGQLVAGGGTGA